MSSFVSKRRMSFSPSFPFCPFFIRSSSPMPSPGSGSGSSRERFGSTKTLWNLQLYYILRRKRRPPLSSCSSPGSSSAPPNTRANHSISSSSTSFASSITPAEFESVLATHRPPPSSRSAAQWAGQKRETPATTPRVSTLAITVDEESEKVAPQVSSLPPSACANACGPAPGPTVAPLNSRSSHLITSSTASSSTSTISSSSSSDIIGTSASSDSWSCSTVVRRRGISLPSTSISGQRGVDRDQWQVRP